MLYKRTNKAGNTMELLSVGDVSFMRAKLDDKLYKTILILKSGEIVHVNLTQVELDELVRKVELCMDEYNASTKRLEKNTISVDPISIDTMLDDLKDLPEPSDEGQE